jgi:hypothetical protein
MIDRIIVICKDSRDFNYFQNEYSGMFRLDLFKIPVYKLQDLRGYSGSSCFVVTPLARFNEEYKKMISYLSESGKVVCFIENKYEWRAR